MAREFRKVVGIRRPILVDDLGGTIHRHFGMLPNMGWILSRTGKVVYKAEWTQPASIERALKEQLEMKRQQRAGKMSVAFYVEKQEYRYRDSALYDGLRRNGPRAFAQVPLFAGMAAAGHWTAIQVCGRATLGDVAISLVAFWAVAGAARSRIWILAPTLRRRGGFVAVGVLITIIMEWLATRVLGRWAYAPAMPVLPILEVGLAPVLPWILVPPLVVWFVRRQLT
jgi:hypothetical protein